MPPEKVNIRNRFWYLSEISKGDVLVPVWWDSEAQARDKLGFDVNDWSCGSFRIHCFLRRRWPRAFQSLRKVLLFVREGIRLSFQQKARFDAIVVYGTNSTGIAGLLLKWLTRSPLIVEIPGVPKKSFLYDHESVTAYNRLRHFVADSLLRLVVRHADCVKLLYPGQLEGYRGLRAIPAHVFHEFVPLSTIQPSGEDGRYVLFAGHPWYLKGVDILVRAFGMISSEYPDYRLSIVGYIDDKLNLSGLTNGHPRIEFHGPMSYEQCLERISKCSVLVLPSRTEGMGRVLLEAMAARKPVIGSDVDGIPYYIQNRETGLIFPSEDVLRLAENLREILSNREFAMSIAENGYQKVINSLSEKAYVARYEKMLASLGA